MEKFYNIADVPYERVSKERILTGFPDLDYDIKGLEIGLTLLVANTNSGKSTFCQGVLANAIKQGYNAWVFSGEHNAQSFLQLIYHQNSQKQDYVPIEFGHNTNIVDWYITEQREKKIREVFDGHLFLYSNKAPRDIEAIIDSMTECFEQQGARFFMIDNLISIDNISSNVFAEQTRITEKLRTFALNKKVVVFLVAHQRKIAERGFRIDIQDVAGSLNISNKAYNVLAQYRIDMLSPENKEYERFSKDLASNGFDIKGCDNAIEVLKTKGNRNGIVGLIYDSETKTYHQAPKISKTEADKIFKSYQKQERLDDIFMDMKEVEDGDLPF